MGNPPHSYRFRVIATALAALAWLCPGVVEAAAHRSAAAGAVPVAETPRNSDALGSRTSLAILDPVDLSQAKPLPQAGEFLRNAFSKGERFRPLSGAETEAKLRVYKWNTGRPCHEFQCAFEAGNVLMAEYILFGTLTPLDGLTAYSFNVLDTQTGRVVESMVGHASRSPLEPGSDPSLEHLAAFAASLDPSRFAAEPKAGQGLIAVLDGNPGSPESRVIAERIGTHVHGFRTHDLMGQAELKELVDAMGIPLGSLAASDTGLIALGARLNVASLVRSKLEQGERGRRLELALFDIAGKRRVRSWTSSPSRDFRDILQFESRFFQTLRHWPEATGGGSDGGRTAAKGESRWGRTLLGLAGLTAAGGLGVAAYASNRKADAAYRRAETSLSHDAATWKKRTEAADRNTMIFGSLAALTLGASVTVWSF